MALYVLSSIGKASQVNIIKKGKMETSRWLFVLLLCLKIVFTGIGFNKILATLRVRKWLVTAVSPPVTSYHFIAERDDSC